MQACSKLGHAHNLLTNVIAYNYIWKCETVATASLYMDNDQHRAM